MNDRWLGLRDGVPQVWARYTNLVVERGIGSWIETIEGERYLDYTCGIGVTNTGHAHPRGQSRGNQNDGAWRVSIAQTRGSSSAEGPTATRLGANTSMSDSSL